LTLLILMAITLHSEWNPSHQADASGHQRKRSEGSNDFRGAADCVAKLLAVLRTRNYRIQLNGVFESTLRACALP